MSQVEQWKSHFKAMAKGQTPLNEFFFKLVNSGK